MKPSDKFIKLVEWSKEDQCYIGSSPGLIGPCCHGKDEAKVYKELCKIIEEWIVIHNEDNVPLPEAIQTKKFSGKFVLRVGEDLHKALAIKATQTGESLNNFCAGLLKKSFVNKKLTRR